MPPHASEELADRLRPFATCFTAAIWRHVPVLVAGALLAPGRRTVTAALRVTGLDRTASFAVYHRVLSTARWSARAVAHRLLLVLVATLVRDGPVVVGIDDTIERRWGARIGARGIYRDPVRSSRGHFVKASGLRWLCLMVMAPMPWGGVWGLPFLTVLAPSERYAHARGQRHKKLTDRARQALLQTARWLPGRRVVAVADSSFSVIELLRVVGRCLCMVTRLRLDAGLYEPAPARKPGTKGRPRVKGARLPSLAERIGDPTTPWRRVTIAGWYGGGERRLDVASGTAVWHHPGMRVPIRWVLVRDAEGEREPQAFLCTDLEADPVTVLGWFVRRWRCETTFEEARRHLGMETQRQWSDLAIERETPCLLGLYTVVTLLGEALHRASPIAIRASAWYPKAEATFSDVLAAVRRECWGFLDIRTSTADPSCAEIPRPQLDRLLNAACYAH